MHQIHAWVFAPNISADIFSAQCEKIYFVFHEKHCWIQQMRISLRHRLQNCLTPSQADRPVGACVRHCPSCPDGSSQKPAVAAGMLCYPARPGLCVFNGSGLRPWKKGCGGADAPPDLERRKWAGTVSGKANRGLAPRPPGRTPGSWQCENKIAPTLSFTFCKGAIANKGSRDLNWRPHFIGGVFTLELSSIFPFPFLLI